MHGSKARRVCRTARQRGVQVEDHGRCLAGGEVCGPTSLHPPALDFRFQDYPRLRTPSMLKSPSRESLSLGMTIPVGGVHQRSGIVKAAGQCGRSLSCLDAPDDAPSNLQRTQNRIRRVPDRQRVAGLRPANAVTPAWPEQKSRGQTGADRCLGALVALPCARGDELTGLDQ